MKNNSKIKIIAEIGINHNGLEEIGKQLITLAFKSGVHAVKFQYRNLENAYSDTVREIGDEILLNEINNNYLSPKQLYRLAQYSKSLGLEIGISFFDVKDILDFGEDIAFFDFYKTPSVELTNISLIDTLIKLGKHVYISTGAHNEDEIDSAFKRLPKNGWTPMHCISNYPVNIQNARLGYIQHLKNKWHREVGYSSHDDKWEVCLIAMQMGATVIERHITLDISSKGLDHSSSSTANHFKKISKFASNFKILLGGNIDRVPNQGELLNRQNLGRSYFAAKNLPLNHILQPADLVYRAPNIGINKTNIDKYLLKPLHVNIRKGDAITHSAFQKEITLPSHIIDFAKKIGLSLPVRLHDLDDIEKLFPIGTFEFHLSFGEILSKIDVKKLNSSNKYSIHLPDYINSTQLMDPFSEDDDQKLNSLKILDRTVALAEQLQELTGSNVPVVGSFSVVHSNRDSYFSEYSKLLGNYQKQGVEVIPQWLPPIAWYFGGSVDLHIMNDISDAKLIQEYDLGVCLDVCHMILGRNYFDFSTDKIMKTLNDQIRHIHIADAIGIDGEGLAIGSGEPENISLIKKALDFKCIKVLEVWQGHFDQGAGFRSAILKLAEIYDDEN
ncbi:MAG: N-acetylneuraminate synthase family protein [gamma proteobacterium symbiont of Lucinoma myriamae]|nr:N-acetylneuraminate synthase family protein [gamma proteobacterium symbiont of Lucinoma myriamae]MCU7819649.1 N-acetylneuraminate synthase family protein [gamma proteobacterium symbiont of Lucinoma myriamae]